MINFRYHLISLIAVFAALAVGVVLGAGPLQMRLNTALESSKDSDSGATASQLAAAKAMASTEAKGLEQIESQFLPGTLTDVAVATVALPGADESDVQRVRAALEKAGAKLVGAVALTDQWDSTSMSTYRQTLATPLESHTNADIPADTTADGVVGYAIAQVLTTTGSETDLVRDIITDDSTPILEISEDPKGGAQALVLVGARSVQTAQADSHAKDTSARALDAWVGTAKAIAAVAPRSVLVGDASQDSSMVAQLRALDTPISTVDSPASTLAALNAALAVAQAGDSPLALGVGVGATNALPSLK
ncbi:copper transporter [Schaalia sp. ZJ1691]|uniref:copper transporter n=1 Tax=Schaalia sp. ZJ1691 TaxID=2709404 RepID=UPI0013ED6878|nr:copper transporter [Schaalia sp. ZJ1691]